MITGLTSLFPANRSSEVAAESVEPTQSLAGNYPIVGTTRHTSNSTGRFDTSKLLLWLHHSTADLASVSTVVGLKTFSSAQATCVPIPEITYYSRVFSNFFRHKTAFLVFLQPCQFHGRLNLFSNQRQNIYVSKVKQIAFKKVSSMSRTWAAQ